MEYQTERIQTCQTKEKVTDQFYLNQDLNVPDAKPDVARVILASGKAVLEDVRFADHYVKLTGKLKVQVLYAAEEGEYPAASLEGRIPFEEMVYLEEADGSLVVTPVSTEVTAAVINSRKLEIKGAVEISVGTETICENKIVTDISDEEIPLYKKYKDMDVLNVHSAKKDVLRIREEASLQGTRENIDTLLWTDITLRKFDTRIAEDQITVQGELLLFCLYGTENGKTDWTEQALPFEGTLACGGAESSMYHQIWPKLTEVSAEPQMDEDGQMRLIAVDGAVEVRYVVYKETRLRLLEDLYALEQTCIPEKKEMRLHSLLMQNHSKCKVAEQLSLPEIKDAILQICHSSARIQVDSVEKTREGLQIEGLLHVNFLYLKADDQTPYDTWQGMVPFSYLLEGGDAEEGMEYDLTWMTEQLSVSLLGSDEIEVRAVLAFQCFFWRPAVLSNIEEITFQKISQEEQEKRPGITGYIVRNGDSLWDLAKRYQTTQESICKVNGLEDGEIKTGDKILIFKENMSIL